MAKKKTFDKARIKEIETKLYLDGFNSINDEDKLYYREYRNSLYEEDTKDIITSFSSPVEMLAEKYEGTLSPNQSVFVNCLVLNNVSREQAFLYAYPESAKHTRAWRNFEIGKLMMVPKVKEYYEDLNKIVLKEQIKNYKWNKELAVAKLTSIVDAVEEKMKPKYNEYGELEDGDINKTQADILLGAIKELNNLEGLNAPTKIDANIQPVIFQNVDNLLGDDDVDDGKTN